MKAAKPKPISTRHKWPDRVADQHNTDRRCPRCGIVKRSRHEPGQLVWVEWFRDGIRIAARATPICDARLERDAMATPVCEPA